MTSEEAIATIRARWDHPIVDPADVLERVAVRLEDSSRHYSVVACPPSVRLFLALPEGFVSQYVHAVRDVDRAIDVLVAMAPQPMERAE